MLNKHKTTSRGKKIIKTLHFILTWETTINNISRQCLIGNSDEGTMKSAQLDLQKYWLLVLVYNDPEENMNNYNENPFTSSMYLLPRKIVDA